VENIEGVQSISSLGWKLLGIIGAAGILIGGLWLTNKLGVANTATNVAVGAVALAVLWYFFGGSPISGWNIPIWAWFNALDTIEKMAVVAVAMFGVVLVFGGIDTIKDKNSAEEAKRTFKRFLRAFIGLGFVLGVVIVVFGTDLANRFLAVGQDGARERATELVTALEQGQTVAINWTPIWMALAGLVALWAIWKIVFLRVITGIAAFVAMAIFLLQFAPENIRVRLPAVTIDGMTNLFGGQTAEDSDQRWWKRLCGSNPEYCFELPLCPSEVANFREGNPNLFRVVITGEMVTSGFGLVKSTGPSYRLDEKGVLVLQVGEHWLCITDNRLVGTEIPITAKPISW
jgi:hypothetical protein